VGSGAEPQPKSNLVHYNLKILHLVTRILVISLIINRPNLTHSKHPGKSGQKFSTIWTVLSTVNQ